MDKIKVMPLGEFSYQTFPIYDEICFELTEEQIQKLINHKLKWIYGEEEVIEIKDLEKPIYNDNREIIGYNKMEIINPHASLIDCDEEIEETNIFEIEELKYNLSQTDYIALKLAEAVADDDLDLVEEIKTTYATELANRRLWRARINELEETLK